MEHVPSVWHEAPEDRRSLVESFDQYSGIRNGLKHIASRDRQWAGIPMPLEGQRLVIEPTYPKAKELAEIGLASLKEVTKAHWTDGAKLRNVFWSSHMRSEIVISEKEGKIRWGFIPSANNVGMALETLRSADAWGIEQESNAVNTLAGLVSHRQFKQYMLTGMFLESSKRTGLFYLFRRLRPTLVLGEREGKMIIRCALCLHPIAYYENSWAGAMCPTDDVIAHLMLMRGDEPMLWRRANQHPAYRPEAGV